MKLIKISIIFLLFVNIFLLYKFTMSPTGIFYYLTLKKIKENYEKKIQHLNLHNIELSQKIQLIKNNKEFQEKIIRQRLHFGRKNEFIYIRVN
ncbi:FtsB family cell division protein [Desulfothermus sp.]